MNSNSKLKKLARALLATTCLTAGAAAANASTFLETTYPGGDFPSFATVAALGSGIDTVDGSVGSGDSNDYFQISGLLGNHIYLIGFTAAASDSAIVFNSSNSGLLSLNPGTSGTLAAPANGIMNFEVDWEGPFPGAYTVTLNDTSVPEPGTVALTGIAAAALLARRRKK